MPRSLFLDDDQGELWVAIGHVDGNVAIEFGASVRWAALPPELARQVVQSLIKHAMAIDGIWPVIEIEL